MDHTRILGIEPSLAIFCKNKALQKINIRYQIKKETPTKMYTTFQIRFNQRYDSYAHFGHWTTVSDP